MKAERGWRDSRQVLAAVEPLMMGALAEEQRRGGDVEAVYQQHADFVWRTLQHLGVRDADLEDLAQEVFVAVHRNLASFDQRSKLTTWLFGICLHIVQRHRRRAYFRFELLHAEPPERVELRTPEAEYAGQQARLRLERLLDKLSPERRVTFVLFELEGATCEEIAELTSVPVGTVYSRLHLARKQVASAVARQQRRQAEEA